jgi:GNAT superfamily N-acetyltransferase
VEHGSVQRSAVELGLALAQRIEGSEARNVANWASEHIEIGGGIASFAGPTSPISHAIGVGMQGPVTEADLDRLEDFYGRRGAPSSLDLCPLADPSLAEMLGLRGYRITEFNNVLVVPITPGSRTCPAVVRIAQRHECEVWTRTMIAGFFERENLTAEELAIGASLFAMPGAAAFLAEVDGVPAAAGAAAITSKVALLFGDSTLPRYRRRGLHTAIIEARVAWAAGFECDLATACTIPGSGSQRNYQRAGFHVAYTKMNMVREL